MSNENESGGNIFIFLLSMILTAIALKHKAKK